MQVTVDTSEVHELADDIRRNADETPARASLAVRKTGFDMEATAHILVPKDTDYLDSTISTDFDADGLGFELGPTAEYGGYVEEGVDHPYLIHNAWGLGITVTHPPSPPQPYLGPAYDAHLPNLERAMGAIGGKAVDRG